MKCKKCGYELNENWKACPMCCSILEDKNVGNENIENKQELNDYKGMSIVYIIVFLISFVYMILNWEIKIPYTIALISIVLGFINDPKNKIIKILLLLFVLFSISLFWFLFICSLIF